MARVLEFHKEESGYIHSGFVQKSFPSQLVKLWTHEVSLGSDFLCLFACKLNLKTWFHEGEISWDLEVKLEHSTVHIEPGPEEKSSAVFFPQVKALEPSIPV